MDLIIKISDEDYKFIKDLQSLIIGGRGGYKTIQKNVINAIRNGTPYNPSGDAISREDLINAKPEFLNEKVVRDTKYQTTKSRIYVKAWNACNSEWLNTIKNAPTVEPRDNFDLGYVKGLEDGKPKQGEWIKHISELYPNESTEECPFCHEEQTICGNDDNFCPNCGADMKGGAE